ncbi:cytochrome c oxidase subunit II [Halorarum halophilum]|uniref:cytochrome-c oxidase n=1 Tax=Halorarum halophilum TaxID=2743090 RepID=A0A7D5GLS0_9EURY|nr:cytochrome c oxidase subunit II [Halobaculum halophilum]QLG28224.1 cytochrome c oxidase subunit II [Halobaculum halophilum]
MILDHTGAGVGLAPLQNGIVPRGTRVQVFQQIFDVFLVLGTLVGVVVVGYMLYNAYKYRADADVKRGNEDLPTLGELPTGSGGGGKLFVSFTLSAVIVISLIAWTYGALAFVEDPPTPEDTVEVEVVGFQFGWKFIYPNGYQDSTLRVPVDTNVKLSITSEDVFHNIGVPELRVKSDAIPGQTTDTWFIADERGTYMAQCYELCGVGHSYMTAEVKVMPQDEYEAWYANTTAENGTASGGNGTAGNGTAGNGTASNSTAHALGGA